MRPPARVRAHRRFTRLLLLVVAVVAASLSQPGAIASAATPAPWQPIQRPWTDGTAVNDIAAARPSFLAAAGAQGKVAVSHTGGFSWTRAYPADAGFVADLLGVAFSDAAHGVVVGVGGTLLVTSDGGQTWRVPEIAGTPPAAALNDVALAGARAVAVGDGGAALESADGGESWGAMRVPTVADLGCVAVTDNGTVVVGADDGSVLVRRGATWTGATLTAPVTGVAARPSPLGGGMTIVASSGWEVAGSEDGVGFSTLLSAVYASEPSWPSLAWGGMPTDELLVAGPAGAASFYAVTPATWTIGADGLGDPRAVTTTPAQSVAYVLGADGRVSRTLSSGRTAATLAPGALTIKAGRQVGLDSTVSIAAPGELVVEQRIGSGTWRDAQRIAWSSSDWRRVLDLELDPLLTTYYRLRFAFGGLGGVVSPTRRVIVRPRLTPDKIRISVSRGHAYRFKGAVYPALRGERIRLYTDRGGKWHRITLGGVVRLRDGMRWVSRLFGTPVRERYHLRARIVSTTRHGSSWSTIVTVVVT